MRGLAGQQGLYGKIERFQQLSTKANKEMTALEPIHADIETDRLENLGPEPEQATTEPGSGQTRLKPIK